MKVPKKAVKRNILSGAKTASKQRKLAGCGDVDDVNDDDDDGGIADEEAYLNFLDEGSDGKLKDANDDWNSVHVKLRKHLEKSGTLDRYGIPHLSLWTDFIMEGRVSGVGEEPEWSKHLDIVGIEPVPKHLSAGLGKQRGTTIS